MSNNEEKLEAWVKEKLEEYDNNPEFQAKRDKKHNDRDGYEGHLRKQVEAKLEGKTHTFSESAVHWAHFSACKQGQERWRACARATSQRGERHRP